jgi:dephospho-CoA kinase
MLVIGLTGSIGTGKSAVTGRLEQLGAKIINADHVGHDAYTPNSEIWNEVVRAFGEEILEADGAIDRKKLGALVFSDPEQLAKLNAIMHPRMAGMVSDRIEQFRAVGASVVVVEAALMFEAGWETLVDEVWVVDSPLDLVMKRLYARNGMDEAEVNRRIKSQMDIRERLERADVVVDNGGDLAALEQVVDSLWESRIKGRVEQI